MKRILSALLSGLILFLAGCADTSIQEEPGVQFYYSVSSDQEFGPAIAAEAEQIDQMTVEILMLRLLQGPTTEGLSRTFPAGTTLQAWVLQDGVLTVDLSEAFGDLSGIALTKAEYCIVLTLCQLDGVDRVSITVDGRALPGMSAVSMGANDVILKGETQDPITVSSQLYFPLTDHTGLGVEYREFEVATTDVLSQANGVLDQLLLGPKEEEMTPFLGSAGLLNAVEIQGERCVVEIDSSTLGAICVDELVFPLYLYSVVDSLTELTGIDSVSFVMEGSGIVGLDEEYTARYEF